VDQGRQAGRLLVDALTGGPLQHPERVVTAPTRLVVRGTTAPPQARSA